MLAFVTAFILYFIQRRIKWRLCTSIMYQDAIAAKIYKLFDFFNGKNILYTKIYIIKYILRREA